MSRKPASHRSLTAAVVLGLLGALTSGAGDLRRESGHRRLEGTPVFVRLIIIGEEITRRLDFRQYVNNALRALKCGNHSPFEEIGGNIDAAEGNAVIKRCRRCQALPAMVLRLAGYDPVHGDVVFIIHPKKV